MAKIGFIGLGIMGRPMAGHLLEGGHELFIHTRRAPPKELIDKGAVACANGKEVGQKAEAIITMVPDTPDVEAVLFGANGVADGLSRGKTVVDMSSISPIATKEFAKKVNALGCDYLDAPVSGGEVGAKAASLTIMVGGPEAAFEKVKPIFALMGKNVTLVGGNGDGQTTKVANQIIVALTIEAVGEALVFASKAGADPARVRQALMGGFAASRILEVHGERMIKRNFEPGFRSRCTRRTSTSRCRERVRSASACPIRRRARNCSTPRSPPAARHGTIPAWRACSRASPATKSATGRRRPEEDRARRGRSDTHARAAVAAGHVRRRDRGRLSRQGGSPQSSLAAGGADGRCRRGQGRRVDGPRGRSPLAGGEAALRPCRHALRPRRRALKRIEVVEAAHPVPDAAGQEAAGRILDLVTGLGPDDLVLCLISGGGSALLSAPAAGITLDDKQAVNKALLKSGASIHEINCVRKHLSAIKGGRLAVAAAPARIVSLIISDVPGDDPSVIASGPTTPDATTLADAKAVLKRYGIVPPRVGRGAARQRRGGDPEARRSGLRPQRDAHHRRPPGLARGRGRDRGPRRLSPAHPRRRDRGRDERGRQGDGRNRPPGRRS